MLKGQCVTISICVLQRKPIFSFLSLKLSLHMEGPSKLINQDRSVCLFVCGSLGHHFPKLFGKFVKLFKNCYKMANNDGFWSSRRLNYCINMPDKIWSFSSGATTSMVVKIELKKLLWFFLFNTCLMEIALQPLFLKIYINC